MVRNEIWVAAILALLALVLQGPNVQAQKKALKANKQWSGSLEDRELQKKAPKVITKVDDLKKLWETWKIADKMPMVDFMKEIVVVETTVGSLLKLSFVLDEKGDMKVLGLGTLDLRPGFRYVVATVNREGVKTVNGKKLE